MQQLAGLCAAAAAGVDDSWQQAPMFGRVQTACLSGKNNCQWN